MEMAHPSVRLIIRACRNAGLLRNQTAYVLATAYHETGKFRWMQEIWGPTAAQKRYEGRSDLGNSKTGDGKRFLGRGFVQITGRRNYTDWSKRLGVDLVANPSLAEKPEYAVRILVEGMLQGTFTGKKLSDYITLQKSDFKNARRIVNGTDKAELIAGYAKDYDKALLAEGYGVDQVVTAPAADVVPEPVVEKPVSKSSRFWTWFSTGGGAAVMPFVDWKVQMVIVAAILLVAGYAIFTMPQAKAKLEKLVDAL